MKKLIVLILLVACGAGLYFVLKGGGNGPKAVAGKYIEAVQRGDYKAALDLTALDEKTKEQYVALIKEKGGERKDSELIASYELGDESVDEEAGTASVVAHLTWADGHTTDQTIPLTKNDAGEWVVKDVK